ncbi:alpha-1,3/1,6-mannosyltransferase ALG2 [Episyrphus balteatus]|uniref:alpha-1,3/1,6-mannosyltransferase ALG2 n=1 Tax=Episyrphus balteatus TaxID=286459 RepID=UPI0024861456|nr:alpha-1,3/1,6-mannosyltransferase ALG2 [Episyrphus balteatus]
MVRVLFLHPDLGIGGAERLVVDAALALHQKGHKVSFLTNHHDPTHCFDETRDGTLFVQSVGDWLPRKIFGRFYAFCAYFRMLYAAFYASLCLSRREKIDIIFCDQISIGIPILRLAKHNPKIVFYCHFPDQLLSAPEGYLKSVYRAPINYLEEYTTGLADSILVNSKFTLRIFRETFKRLDVIPDVLYPSLNTNFFDKMKIESKNKDSLDIPSDAFMYLSINRYERKKNHELALHSFKLLEKSLSRNDWQRCRLVIAGGYDLLCTENMVTYDELVDTVAKLELQNKVILLKSPSDIEKIALLQKTQCLLYTPENEHFGIVPLEGMYMSKPVIALNSGGPTETIVHNSTGILCEKDSQQFSKAMCSLFKDQQLCERMGEMGRKRVQQKFSFESFGNKIESIIRDLLDRKSKTN